ncbi:hypothetical protein [Aurantiacibacter spongiae]|nr:hypothetical protein [Aurantiacibacter spongiae]
MTEPMKRRDVLKPHYRFRSAITGQYVSRLYALLHKDTTVRERVR